MASAHADLPHERGIVAYLSNPWSWMAVALVCCGTASFWIPVIGDRWPVCRFSLVVVGLFCGLVSLNIRFRSTESTFLSGLRPLARDSILLALMLLFGAMAIGLTGMLIVAGMRPHDVWWRFGPTFVAWIVVAPMSLLAMLQALRRLRLGEPLSRREEGAILLLLAAVSCFAATWGLYDPAAPLRLDKMRLFLGVLTLVSLVAAPLVLLSPTARYRIVSIVIVLHFGGILTATLVVSPSPMADTQAWNQLSRPYLEFFYLTNAYHFYSPDPGPNTYLWFRVQFADDTTEGPVAGEWFKVPDVDEHGRNSYPSKEDLSRYLVMTWNTLHSDTLPPFFAENVPLNDVYERRAAKTPKGAGIIGADELDKAETNIVPWHPDYYSTQQHTVPSNVVTRTLLPSFVKHLVTLPRWEGKGIKGIKIYRVNHQFLPPDKFRLGIVEPGDPDTYGALYLGRYDTSGSLMDADDPLLYWFIPVIREVPLRDSPIRCYIRRHAGDPLWIRDSEGKWVAPPPK